MTAKKKAIILLYPPYEDTDVSELEKALIKVAKKNNLEIIKSICAKSNDQKGLLEYLIKTVKEQSSPVTVIMKDLGYISFANIIVFSVLGVLEMCGLIEVCLYEEKVCTSKKTGIRKLLELHVMGKEEIQFLPVAQYNLDKLMRFVPSNFINTIK